MDENIEAPLLEHRKATNKGWFIAFVAAASQAMICKGLNNGLLGPTLPFLVLNINSSIDQTSSMLTGRAIGTCSGAFAFSVVKRNVKDARVSISISIILFVMAIIAAIMPFATTLVELVVLQVVCGFAIGYSVTGLTSLYLEKWGESRSRSILQLNYFMYTVGGFVAPLIARPFLEMENQLQNRNKTSCPRQHATVQADAVTFNKSSPLNMDVVTVNPISWAYIIICIYMILVAIFLCILAIGKVEDKLGHHDEKETESRPEQPLKQVWMFLLSVLMFNFFCVSSSLLCQAYIYSTVVCSGLQMRPSEASLLNSIFWVGFGIGRGSAVFTSKFFKPSTLIITDLVGTISIMTAMTVWGEHSSKLMWGGTFAFGIFVATLFPSGISWSSEVTNMSGKYVFPFVFGGNIGALIWYRVAGAAFQMNSFSPIYLITTLCVATAICFGFMNYFARSARKQRE